MDRLVVIILVGLPGSGKTSWAIEHYPQFTRLDGDSLKTSAKVVKALLQALQRRENVVVDATNVSLQRRKDIIDAAKPFGARIMGVVFRIPMAICMDRTDKREAAGGPHIPKIAFYKLNKDYVDPSLAEGFEFIGSIDP